MPIRKHTACSSCGSRANCRFLEVLWRTRPSGPYHCVEGWLCAVDRRATLDFIGQLARDFLVLE